MNREQENSEILLSALKSEFSRVVPESYKSLNSSIPDSVNRNSLQSPWVTRAFADIIQFRIDQALPSNSQEELYDRLSTEPLTPMGQLLKEKLTGGTVIDLGCGNAQAAPFFRVLGVKRYIGVDTNLSDGVRLAGSQEIYTVKSDMLTFVASAQDNQYTFFLSGIEDQGGEHKQVLGSSVDNTYTELEPSEYMRQLLVEVSRATVPNGVLVVSYSSLPNPESYGFKLITEGEETYVYQKLTEKDQITPEN